MNRRKDRMRVTTYHSFVPRYAVRICLTHLAHELKDTKVKVISAHPLRVKTDSGLTRHRWKFQRVERQLWNCRSRARMGPQAGSFLYPAFPGLLERGVYRTQTHSLHLPLRSPLHPREVISHPARRLRPRPRPPQRIIGHSSLAPRIRDRIREAGLRRKAALGSRSQVPGGRHRTRPSVDRVSTLAGIVMSTQSGKFLFWKFWKDRRTAGQAPFPSVFIAGSGAPRRSEPRPSYEGKGASEMAFITNFLLCGDMAGIVISSKKRSC